MRSGFIILLSSAALLPITAGSTEIFSVPTLLANGVPFEQKVNLIPQVRCQEILGEIYFPEQIIKDGLTALSSPGSLPDVSSCSDDLSAHWDLYFPVSRRKLDRPGFYWDNSRALEIESRLRCFQPDHKKAELMFEKCGGKWITAAEADQLRKEKAVEERRATEAFIDWTYEFNLPLALDRLLAQNAAKKGQSDNEVFQRNQNLDRLLAAPGFLDSYDLPKLKRLARALHCYSAFPNGSKEDESFRLRYKTECQGQFVPEQLAMPLMAAIHGELSGIEEALNTAASTSKLILERTKPLPPTLAAELSADYDLRRLVLRYNAYLRLHAHDGSLEKFCGEYQAQQEQDARYRAAGFSIGTIRTGGAQDVARKWGLSEGELTAIETYTGAYFKKINPTLNSGAELKPEEKVFLAQMEQALKRLPPYVGMARRFSKLPPEVLAKHSAGATVCYPAYTSTSRRDDWAWDGANEFIMFAAKNARSVDGASMHPSEAEVLFLPNTCFKILAKKPRGDGSFRFVMVEADEAGKPLYPGEVAVIPGK